MNASPEQGERRFGNKARILVPLAVFLLMLGVGELAFRVIAPLPFSSRLYWIDDGHVKARLEPGQDPVNTSGNVVRINSLGFRGEDPAWEAAEGTLRILVLGGSSAFSYDASDDAHTWPSLLESQLADALGKPVEVINLGLPGYDASNSKVNYLFTGRALNPHVVLIYQTWNDLKFLRLVDQKGNGTPRELLSGVNAGGRNLSAFERFFFHSQIVQRVRHVYLRIRNERIENTYTSLEKAGDAANDLPSERAFDQFQKNFEDLALLAKSDGVLPVLVSQATLAQPENLERREVRVSIRNNWVGMTLPVLAQAWLESNRRIEAAAKVGDALFLDGYSAVPPTLENFKDHVHLLDPGAEKLADALCEQLLADPRFRALAAQVQAP
jgi:lysophospholipase L1-like esterase